MSGHPPTKRQASEARKRNLADLTAITAACKCLWPLVKMRNLHGHSPECPAAEVWEAQRRKRATSRGWAR